MPAPHSVPAIQYSVSRPFRVGTAATVILALLLLSVSGCRTPPVPDVQPLPEVEEDLCAPYWQEDTMGMTRWEFRGRVTVHTPQGNNSARMHWQQEDSSLYTVRLQALFGIRLALLRVDEEGAVLRLRGRGEHRAPQVETLAWELLGVRVPVMALSHWVRGLPLPGGAATQRHRGCPLQLQQENWRVEYADYREVEVADRPPWEPHFMPHRILLRDNTHSLQLDISSWRL